MSPSVRDMTGFIANAKSRTCKNMASASGPGSKASMPSRLYRALSVAVLRWVKAGQAAKLNEVKSRRWRRSPSESSRAASVASSWEAALSWFQWERERQKADTVGGIEHVLQARGQQGQQGRVSWRRGKSFLTSTA